jgi:D-serine deaminase-like pyridoxal phosphate-dependent protein
MTRVAELPTPALVVDATAFAHNLDTMTAALPGPRLRPHMKAHKCLAIAREQHARGHTTFTCATPREMIGMARAGFTDDLLLANEVVDVHRLLDMAASRARVTVAVDSAETIDAAVAGGIREVLIDVDVMRARCGCDVADAGPLADRARRARLAVRGVMGYEGHAVLVPDRERRAELTAEAMERLAVAHAEVGGEVISAGGTGTYDINAYATEIQAGSYALMDTEYEKLDLPFARALSLVATVIHANDTWAVADCGLKAQGMDHGNPTIADGTIWFVSDEHITFAPRTRRHVGERVVIQPAHVDPTIAYHDRIYVADGPDLDANVIETWWVDLRGWDPATFGV